MASSQIGLREEDAKAILDILKKYDSPHENDSGDCDPETGELYIKYLECSIQITDFDEKSEEEIIKNMYIQTDTNR